MIKNSIFILLIFSNILYASTFKDIVKKDNMLSSGFTGFTMYQNQNYLVSVGISYIENSSVKAKVNAIKISRIKAKIKLSNFINDTNTKTMESLISVTDIIDDGKNIKRVTKEEYIEIIKEKGDGLLRNITDIGKWKIKNEYFYALGILVEE